MNEKLVSVIIPTHQGSDKISRAVESVINQTYKNIEIIVIDDNGEGHKEQIATEHQMSKYRNEKNITYIKHRQNKNGSAARNTGIKHSTGSFIAFLDDDDVYLSECIAKKVDLFESLSNDYGILFCSFYQEQENTKRKVIETNFNGNLLFDYLMGRIESPSSIIMIRKSVIDKVGYWDESFNRHQDWEFISRVLTKYKGAGLKEIGVHRFILGRHSARNPIEFEKHRIHFLNKLSSIIDNLPENQSKMVYDRHFAEMGKAYFKNRNFLKSIYWVKRTNNPFREFNKYIISGITYLKIRLNYYLNLRDEK
ncbi:glycosyltransferase family 2 protein [Peribacillus frigoritolerans]|uniref:glycosyltransferase family 2 protein n=1 Tax=Peribacillus frigoritolerans TaxID=450367 RepID=UPI0039A153DE